jgi:hypothetical protein
MPPVKYGDRLFVFLVIPFISALNYYLTYSNVQWGFFLLLTFTLDTLEGYCAWFAARWVVKRLDERMPWETHMKKRLIVQIPIVAVVILGILIILTELVNYIARDKPIPTEFYTQDIFIFLIWALFFNFIYLALYFLRRYQQVKNAVPIKSEVNGLLVKTGKTQKWITFDTISFLYVSNELVYAHTGEGKIPLPGYTLDKIEKLLDGSVFFRANRQCIVTRPLVDLVRREENGKLAVQIKVDGENTIMISRLRAPAFKKWMEG